MSEAALTDSTAPMASTSAPGHLGRTSLTNLGAALGQFNKDDISQSLLSIVGNANRANVGRRVKLDPLVVGSKSGYREL
jgi:hypothetical protein